MEALFANHCYPSVYLHYGRIKDSVFVRIIHLILKQGVEIHEGSHCQNSGGNGN